MDTLTGYSNSRRLPSMDNPTSYSDLRQPFGDTLPHSDTGIRAATSIAALTPKRKAGRTKFRETRHPVYRGVRRRNGDRWVCEVREPNKKSRIWLGTYPTPEMAARAHDVAALALRGNSACLNFADSAWLLPTPASTSPEDIKKTAAEAAEVFATESDAFAGDLPNVHVEQQGNLSRLPANDFYIDEEAVFGMHMAEGLLMSPLGVSCGVHWDDVETYLELPLWSHSP